MFSGVCWPIDDAGHSVKVTTEREADETDTLRTTSYYLVPRLTSDRGQHCSLDSLSVEALKAYVKICGEIKDWMDGKSGSLPSAVKVAEHRRDK